MTKIKVVGVGGSGSNTISRMMRCKIKGVDLIAINTDAQDLKKTRAHLKLRIGKNLTKGLGTGMNPEIGRRAAEEQRNEIQEILKDSDMVFVTYGLGGGTGSGAGPVVAEIAKNLGALTVAVVTKPFSFEGVGRQNIAEKGLEDLKNKVDTLLIVANDRLLNLINQESSVWQAFWFCDEVLRQAVAGISDLILVPGIINVDFADVKTIMKNSGPALLGIGKAKGEKRAEEAANLAINSPLLDFSIKGGRAALFNISGREDLTLSEIEEVAKLLTQKLHPQARVIFGAVEDKKPAPYRTCSAAGLKKGEIKVTVIVTGF